MRRPPPSCFRLSQHVFSDEAVASLSRPPIIKIDDATFYRQHPSSVPDKSTNPPLFPNLTFTLASSSAGPQHWSIVGPSSSGKTTLLQILRGQHLCFPPTTRSYPYLASDDIARKDSRLRYSGTAIQYVGFGAGQGGLAESNTKGAYLSARYESRREQTDFSLLDYLKGHTELNAIEDQTGPARDDSLMCNVIRDLSLQNLVRLPVGNLSNGQTRRARIAKALLGEPEVLLLDEPFMGLDPPTLTALSPLLHRLAKANSPRLVLSLRPQDPIPDWITHVIQLGPHMTVEYQGSKQAVLENTQQRPLVEDGECNIKAAKEDAMPILHTASSGSKNRGPVERSLDREPLVEMEGVHVKYGDRDILGNWNQVIRGQEESGLWWTVRRGDRWGIFGPNGSGKTTILSLICSDHPQTYSLPVRLFGRSRLPQPGRPGTSIFDIQARIGHSSPEIHAFFPRSLSVRQSLENAWADTFHGKARLNAKIDRIVDAYLGWFEPDLNPAAASTTPQQKAKEEPVDRHLERNLAKWRMRNPQARRPTEDEPPEYDWADELRFGDLPFSAQRSLLLLRAIIKEPDIVILDEAFSGMDEHLRDKCMLFLQHGESQTFAPQRGDGAEPGKREVGESEVSRKGKVRVRGLKDSQALICVSHVREEVPAVVRDWLCLPEANEGKAAKFGRLDRPLDQDEERWREIWAM